MHVGISPYWENWALSRLQREGRTGVAQSLPGVVFIVSCNQDSFTVINCNSENNGFIMVCESFQEGSGLVDLRTV